MPTPVACQVVHLQPVLIATSDNPPGVVDALTGVASVIDPPPPYSALVSLGHWRRGVLQGKAA
jgi:hypothetical protein